MSSLWTLCECSTRTSNRVRRSQVPVPYRRYSRVLHGLVLYLVQSCPVGYGTRTVVRNGLQYEYSTAASNNHPALPLDTVRYRVRVLVVFIVSLYVSDLPNA